MSKESATTTKLKIENEGFFGETIRAYRHLLGKKRTDFFADFVKDVESASRCALQGTGLFYEWQKLATEDIWPESRVAQRIIRLCASVYREHGLQPDSTPSERKSERSAPRNLLRTPTRALCKEHGVQTVTGRFKDADGNT